MPQDDQALLGRLKRSQVEFVVVGGVACVLHGASYVTYDLDICISLAPQNLYRLETAVEDLHPFHRLAANKLPLELTEELCTRLKNLYLQTDLGVLDCLGEIAGVGDYNKVAERSVVFSFPFGGCRVLSLDALIEAKETIGREKDPRALRFLYAIRDRPKSAGSGDSPK